MGRRRRWRWRRRRRRRRRWRRRRPKSPLAAADVIRPKAARARASVSSVPSTCVSRRDVQPRGPGKASAQPPRTALSPSRKEKRNMEAASAKNRPARGERAVRTRGGGARSGLAGRAPRAEDGSRGLRSAARKGPRSAGPSEYSRGDALGEGPSVHVGLVLHVLDLLPQCVLVHVGEYTGIHGYSRAPRESPPSSSSSSSPPPPPPPPLPGASSACA
jgi:hypothetical protein